MQLLILSKNIWKFKISIEEDFLIISENFYYSVVKCKSFGNKAVLKWVNKHKYILEINEEFCKIKFYQKNKKNHTWLIEVIHRSCLCN